MSPSKHAMLAVPFIFLGMLILIGFILSTIYAGLGLVVEPDPIVAENPVEMKTFQCYDGSFVSDYNLCRSSEEVIESLKIIEMDDLCEDPSNFNLQQIKVRSLLDDWRVDESGNAYVTSMETGRRANLHDLGTFTKWYPSLNEGYIVGYPIWVTNEGCTKVYPSKFSVSIFLYRNGKLISKNENINRMFTLGSMGDDEAWVYPGDIIFAGGIPIKGSFVGIGSERYKIYETGDYHVKVVVYYEGKLVGVVDDTIRITPT